MSKIDILTSEDLEKWLRARSIPINTWGAVEAKSVADLWLEILNGETTLHDSPPRRQVEVVQLLIQQGDATLLEAMQELANGERRYRNLLPSEKIKGDETALAAARRCLHEEFALNETQLAPIQITIEQTVAKEHMSPSYPGLNTIYVLHRARIENFDFPVNDFSTENDAHSAGDPVKAHHWQWTKEIS